MHQSGVSKCVCVGRSEPRRPQRCPSCCPGELELQCQCGVSVTHSRRPTARCDFLPASTSASASISTSNYGFASISTSASNSTPTSTFNAYLPLSSLPPPPPPLSTGRTSLEHVASRAVWGIPLATTNTRKRRMDTFACALMNRPLLLQGPATYVILRPDHPCKHTTSPTPIQEAHYL